MNGPFLSAQEQSLDRPRAFAWFALSAGLLTVLLLFLNLQTPPQSVADLVSFISAHQHVIALTATAVLAWAVFSVPFVVALGRLLRTKSPSIAQAATLLSAMGILLLGFGNFAGIGAILAILSAGTAPSTADRAYQVAIWRNLTFYLTDPGLMTWGLGQLLFGWLGWKSHIIPNWLAVVGIVGGAAGLLTLAVYQSPIMALLQLACFAAWGFSIAVLLFRSGHGLVVASVGK